jgi:hypothetical protein
MASSTLFGGQSGVTTPRQSYTYNYLRKLSAVRVPLVYIGFIAPDIARSNVMEIQKTNYFLEVRRQLMGNTYPEGIFESVSVDSMINTNRPVFFRKNIEYIVKAAKENETQVVLSTFIYSDLFPEQYPELALEGYQNGIKEHNVILRELSIKYGQPMLDLEKESSVDKEWFTDGIHFNLIGNQKRVEILDEFLVPHISQAKAIKDDN